MTSPVRRSSTYSTPVSLSAVRRKLLMKNKPKSPRQIQLSFVDEIIDCYRRLALRPLAMIIIITVSAIAAAKLAGTTGPVEAMMNAVAPNATATGLEASVHSLLYKPLKFIHDNENIFFAVGICVGTYLAYPNNQNMVVAMIISLICLVLHNKTKSLECLLAGHLFYVYTSMRTTTYKFYIIALAVLLYVLIINEKVALPSLQNTTTRRK